MRHIFRCPNCGTYTLKAQCPKDSTATIPPKPPKYSPEDKYAKYRRQTKEPAWKEKGVL